MELLILSLLTVAASFILGVTGFGFAVFLMGFFPLILGIKTSSVLVSIAGLPIVIYLVVPMIKHIHWKVFGIVVAGLLAGTPVGVWLLVKLDERYLMIGLGLFLILYLVYDVFIRARTRGRLPLFVGFLAGLLGGGFGGAFNTSGPPVVAYLSSFNLDKHTVKATILAYITLGTIYKIGFLIHNQMITRSILVYTAVLLVPSFIGMFLGKMVFAKISTIVFRRATQGILGVISILMIVKGVTG